LDLPAGLGRLDRELEAAIYRSVQETLHNIAKHSRAKNATVELVVDKFSVCLQVDDDGVGMPAKRGRRQTFGLMGLRDRIAGLGGTVRIRSRTGRGTRVRVMLPTPRLSIVRRHPSGTGSVAPIAKTSRANSLPELKRSSKSIPILAGRAATSSG
jgi:signal transduction histidine kinase